MNEKKDGFIYVLSYCFPTLQNMQSGRFVLDQCEELSRRGLNVVVLNIAGVKSLPRSTIEEREINGIRVVEVQNFSFALFKFARLTTKIFTHKYRALCDFAIEKYNKPMKFYAHFSFPSGFSANRLSEYYHIPYIVMEHHSIFFRNKLSTFIRKETKRTIMNSDAFFCVSEALKVAISSHTGCPLNKLLILNNVIDKSFTYIEPKKKVRFCFFSAGNLVKIKRFDLLISAASILNMKGIDFCIRIAGQGVEYEALMEKVKKLNLIGNLEFIGRVGKNEMLREYSLCDAFVLVSRRETYGVAFREALIVGRPVISSDNGGINEGWDDAFGVIVNNITPKRLAESMEAMINGYGSYDLKKISDIAGTKFSNESVCSILIAHLLSSNSRV